MKLKSLVSLLIVIGLSFVMVDVADARYPRTPTGWCLNKKGEKTCSTLVFTFKDRFTKRVHKPGLICWNSRRTSNPRYCSYLSNYGAKIYLGSAKKCFIICIYKQRTDKVGVRRTLYTYFKIGKRVITKRYRVRLRAANIS